MDDLPVLPPLHAEKPSDLEAFVHFPIESRLLDQFLHRSPVAIMISLNKSYRAVKTLTMFPSY